MPHMTIMPSMLLMNDLLLSAISVSFITSVCIYIIIGCHLPLGGDWPHAVEYGGCAN